MTLEEYRHSKAYAKQIRACVKSLRVFMRLMFPHAFTLKESEIHADFDRIATDTALKHGVIEVFRESGKSTFFAVGLPLWHRFCEPIKRHVDAGNPWPKNFNEVQAVLRRTEANTFCVIRSKSQGEAKRRLRAIGQIIGAYPSAKREVMKGREAFRVHFGDWRSLIESATKDELRMRDGTLWTALGADQQGHGLQEDFLRPTLVINDDPETEKNTRTLASMETNLDVFMNGLYAGLSPRGRAYSLGTPIVEGCQIRVLRDLSKSMPRWTYRHYPLLVVDHDAEASPHGHRSVWPEKKSVEEALAEKEALAAKGKVYLWYQKYQCEIKGKENQLFTEDDIMLYDGELVRGRSGKWFLRITHLGPYAQRHEGAPFSLTEPEVVPVNLFGGHDPASGVGGDDAVFLTRAYDSTGQTPYDGRHFVVDYVSSNTASTPEQCQWIMEGYAERRHMGVCVEGAFFDESMKTEMQVRSSAGKVYPPLTKITPKLGKGKRYIQELQGVTRAKRLLVRKTHTALIDEMLVFNALRKDNKDDHLDGLWLSMQENWPPYHTTADLGPAPPPPTDLERFLVATSGIHSHTDPHNDWKVN